MSIEKLDTSLNGLFILPVPDFFSRCQGIGGHISHADGILQAMARYGCQVDVFAGEKHAVINKSALTSHIVAPPRPCLLLLGRLLWNNRLVRNVSNILKRKKYDFCYCRHSSGFAPWLPKLKAVLGKIILVLEVNSFMSQRFPFMRLFEKMAFDVADLLLCISETVKNDVLEMFGRSLEEKILVIPNGVSVERFDIKSPRSILDNSRKEIKVGYVGILKPNYGLETLVDAFRLLATRNNKINLYIYGAGPYESILKEYAGGLGNIIFNGPCPMERVPSVLKEMDILVYTASRKNAFQSPIKMFEYMAASRPIVAAETPQVKAVLGKKNTALLFKIGDAANLAEQIIYYVHNTGLARLYAENAFSEVKSQHSWDARIQVILSHIQKYQLEKKM